MANHKSAFKRIRQNKVRRERNRVVRSKVRTYAKKVREAVAAGDLETAQGDLTNATRQFAKAGSKGVMKKKTIARKISRLAKAVNKMQAGA